MSAAGKDQTPQSSTWHGASGVCKQQLMQAAPSQVIPCPQPEQEARIVLMIVLGFASIGSKSSG